MIQVADKTYKNYLKPKEKTALDIYYHNGEQDLLKACKQAKYYGQDINKKAKDLLIKPAAIEYLEDLRKTQIPQIDIFTRVSSIAIDTNLRPEVQLDALSLLSKLEEKRGLNAKNDDILPVPASPKDRIQWHIDQLKALGNKGKAGLALADDIMQSVYSNSGLLGQKQ